MNRTLHKFPQITILINLTFKLPKIIILTIIEPNLPRKLNRLRNPRHTDKNILISRLRNILNINILQKILILINRVKRPQLLQNRLRSPPRDKITSQNSISQKPNLTSIKTIRINIITLLALIIITNIDSQSLHIPDIRINRPSININTQSFSHMMLNLLNRKRYILIRITLQNLDKSIKFNIITYPLHDISLTPCI